MFNMKICESQHVTLNHVTISAPADSTKTDGLHISRSSNINVIDLQIATGNDCISIGEGSSYVNIIGVFCGPGHGIGVGSLGKEAGEQDVSSVTFTNCTLTDTTNGIRIKTFASPISITAQELTFQHIIMKNVENPIIINLYYCPEQKSCPQTLQSNGESSVELKGVKFIDVQGSSATQVAVKLDCSGSRARNIHYRVFHLSTVSAQVLHVVRVVGVVGVGGVAVLSLVLNNGGVVGDCHGRARY